MPEAKGGAPDRAPSSLPAAALAALGVVFGDIGTSPLYTLKTVLALTGERPDPSVTLGALSLVIWTLIVVTSIKYVSVAMRINNDGEGGILALMALLGVKHEQRPVIVAAHSNVTLWACRPCIDARGLDSSSLDRRVKLGGMNDFHAATKQPDARMISF